MGARVLNVAAFESMVDSVSHRDNLSTSTVPASSVPPGGWILDISRRAGSYPEPDLEGKVGGI
jgi:hypothetical protein